MSNKYRTKIAYCTCGRWIQIASMPEAEIDDDISSSFKELAKEGYKIDIIDKKDIPEGYCDTKECKKNNLLLFGVKENV